MAKRPALPHVRCQATCWKGDPDNSMAPKARCIYNKDQPHTVHEDENGNHFTGSGDDSEVLTIR